MKRFSVLIVFVMVFGLLSGCGSAKDERDLSVFIEAFEDAGATDRDEPFYQMIDAIDGVIFYGFNDETFSIYEYGSIKDLEKAKKEHDELIEDWPTNGKFLLEAEAEGTIEIFENVEQ